MEERSVDRMSLIGMFLIGGLVTLFSYLYPSTVQPGLTASVTLKLVKPPVYEKNSESLREKYTLYGEGTIRAFVVPDVVITRRTNTFIAALREGDLLELVILQSELNEKGQLIRNTEEIEVMGLRVRGGKWAYNLEGYNYAQSTEYQRLLFIMMIFALVLIPGLIKKVRSGMGKGTFQKVLKNQQ